MIKFNCPACGKKIAVQDEHAGKKARCPGCKQTITIPAQTTQQDIPVAETAQPAPTPSQTPGPQAPPPQQPPYYQQQQSPAQHTTVYVQQSVGTRTRGYVPTKSKGVAYLLWLLGIFGILGLHRFYLGKIGTGLLWLFTLGLCGVGAFIDLFTLGTQVDVINSQRQLRTL